MKSFCAHLFASLMTANNVNGDDDIEQFRKAMLGVKPHAPVERVARNRPRPPPRARQSEADEAAVLSELLSGPDPEIMESGETLSYRADGVQDRILRQLRRGAYRREAELDLHGLNREKARREVAEFLLNCEKMDLRCVRIIHGKGKGSPNSGPVLKQLLDGWLRKVKNVIAFCSAQPRDGGTGAIYVLLRRAS